MQMFFQENNKNIYIKTHKCVKMRLILKMLPSETFFVFTISDFCDKGYL
jgi:hypothetical protein